MALGVGGVDGAWRMPVRRRRRGRACGGGAGREARAGRASHSAIFA